MEKLFDQLTEPDLSCVIDYSQLSLHEQIAELRYLTAMLEDMGELTTNNPTTDVARDLHSKRAALLIVSDCLRLIDEVKERKSDH